MTHSIARIHASSESGNASVATIQDVRAPNATTLTVDTVTDIPATSAGFYASMGTPHTFTDPVTNETITVISEATCVDFQGHVNSGNIEIDAIAPGYVDNGSAIGDIVIIKPTTQWSDNVADVLAIAHNDDGTSKDWNPISATLTYTSWDSTNVTGVMGTSIDLTGVIGVGQKVKITQTTVKYFIVTAITSTAITGYFGTDYTLANAAITSPYYSSAKSPVGFPLDPVKWTVTVTNSSQALKSSPSAGSWYGGSLLSATGPSISIPIGVWNTYYKAVGESAKNSTSNSDLFATLSTANNSESDTTQTVKWYFNPGISGSEDSAFMMQCNGHISVTTATPYYLNIQTDAGGAAQIALDGNLTPTIIRAVCAYL